MSRPPRIFSIVVAAFSIAATVAGAAEEVGTTTSQPADPLIGYWDMISTTMDGEVTNRHTGGEAYFVIYENQTVCFVQLQPSGEYWEDSELIWERDKSHFIMSFSSDFMGSLWTGRQAFTSRLSAAADTLYFEAEPTAYLPDMVVVFVRKDSIPDCGCDEIR